jgi:hypothetical protein
MFMALPQAEPAGAGGFDDAALAPHRNNAGRTIVVDSGAVKLRKFLRTMAARGRQTQTYNASSPLERPHDHP